MTSDEERREVARRLRETGDELESAALLWYHIAKALGVRTATDGKTACGMLADLIEPSCDRRAERMCRNLNPPSCRDFECSECGESSEFTPGFMPNYCPNCGARVIKEES